MKLFVLFMVGLLSLSGSSGAQSSQSDLRCTLTSKSSFTQGEPILLRLKLENSSNEPRVVNLGYDREGAFLFRLTPPDGFSIDLPQTEIHEGISLLGELAIPAHESHSQQIILDNWQKFTEPGPYRVAFEILYSQCARQELLPKNPAILFNAGLAAFSAKDFALASDLWQQLKTVDPQDWHARSKLIQAYQALGKMAERDKEREELFAMWKSGKPAELKEQFQYCRDQFEVNGKKVMAFEHFELKGDRALRYVFSILNKTEDGEEYRISLGSYRMTDAIWRATTKPKPKDNERLFHLDGYFPNRHVTYGMFFPEPTYNETRAKVIKILEGNGNPQ